MNDGEAYFVGTHSDKATYGHDESGSFVVVGSAEKHTFFGTHSDKATYGHDEP